MHKDPARRYRDGRSADPRRRPLPRGEPLEARPDTLRYRLGKFVRRNWRAASAAAASRSRRRRAGRRSTRCGCRRAQRRRSPRRRGRSASSGSCCDLFEGGDDEPAGGQPARRHADRSRRAGGAQASIAEPAVQAELLRHARRHLPAARKLPTGRLAAPARARPAAALLGAEHPDVAESLVALGLLRVDQAKLRRRRAARPAGPRAPSERCRPDHPVVARATAALGHVLVERGAYDEATRRARGSRAPLTSGALDRPSWPRPWTSSRTRTSTPGTRRLGAR